MLELFGSNRRSVKNFNGVSAARNLDDRCRPLVVREMFGEAIGVKRCRGNDDSQVTAFGEQSVEVSDQEIDVQGTLVSLVQYDDVVLFEEPITLCFREENPVGH